MISIELTANDLASIVFAVVMAAAFIITLVVAGSNYGD